MFVPMYLFVRAPLPQLPTARLAMYTHREHVTDCFSLSTNQLYYANTGTAMPWNSTAAQRLCHHYTMYTTKPTPEQRIRRLGR